jgi:hypothetical protein
VPSNQQSNGKILKRRTRKVVNRAATPFRNAATTLVRSQSYLGAQYRRLRTRLGAPKAITAMGAQAGLPVSPTHPTWPAVCRQRNGILWARHREQQIRSLIKWAKRLGFQLVAPNRT